ncbi:MAG TPA: hypothetical protein DIT64_19615, partial [Verrucomicrobiales bacterium]|nr:hypothetical protein [Verrucomicrobiales bacterium]
PDSLLLHSAARRDAFTFIDYLPWDQVHHAYGQAIDARSELRRLISDDEDERMDAICGFLYSSAFHQYTIYPATPFAMLSVLRILDLPDVPDLSSGMRDRPMAFELLHFIRICAERGQVGIHGTPHPVAPTIEQVTSTCESICHRFLTHIEPCVRSEAEALSSVIARTRQS